MKKLIVICEILVVCALLAKILTFGSLVGKSDKGEYGFVVKEVLADTSNADYRRPIVKDVIDDPLDRERELLTLLKKKRTELNEREELLAEEQERLSGLKQEIAANIEILNEMKEEITTLIKSAEVIDDTYYKSLAKVYEKTPPDRAGVMLTKLDKKIAAAIIMQMKSKSAGLVWGHIDPATAVEITKEITGGSPHFNKMDQ